MIAEKSGTPVEKLIFIGDEEKDSINNLYELLEVLKTQETHAF